MDTPRKCRNGFVLPFEKFPQPLLICSDKYNGLAFGWTCAPNGSEFKIVCAKRRLVGAISAVKVTKPSPSPSPAARFNLTRARRLTNLKRKGV